jgi:hypothetical protein
MKALKYNGRLYIPATKSHTVSDVVDVDAMAEQIERIQAKLAIGHFPLCGCDKCKEIGHVELPDDRKLVAKLVLQNGRLAEEKLEQAEQIRLHEEILNKELKWRDGEIDRLKAELEQARGVLDLIAAKCVDYDGYCDRKGLRKLIDTIADIVASRETLKG